MLPRFDQVPSFKRLSLGGLTPEASLEILDKAADQLAHAETLLRF